MFERNYMDYHKNRFRDHSLLFYSEEELIAILPMSEGDEILTSHGGLTYGGFIIGKKMKQHLMNECMEKLIIYARENGFKEINYKTIPHIYHLQPAEEDRYSLFIHKAQLERVESSTVVNLAVPLKMPKGRKAQISRAKREGCIVEEKKDYDSFAQFIELENQVLLKYHNTKAVHTAEEINFLHNNFPNNIHLYTVMKDNIIIAGSIIFEYDEVIHTQYMAANEEGRRIGALDLVISEIMTKYRDEKKWLDFGISTEDNGRILNSGLIAQKEGFGGRTNVYEMWKLKI